MQSLNINKKSHQKPIMFELIIKFEDEAERGMILTYDDIGNVEEAAMVYREMGAIVTVKEL